MHKRIVAVFLFFLPIVCLAQVTFEKGFFIDNSGTKVTCFIKNIDWKDSPTHFEYKLSNDGVSQTINTSSLQEFGIDNFSKYVNKRVKIDRSSDDFDSLTAGRWPVWSDDQLVLKVLIEGKASLYFYQNGSLVRFFYSTNGNSVQQLVYRKYLLGEGVGINSDFRQQLWMEVRCGQSAQNPVSNISYSKGDLVRYFKNYNECSGQGQLDFTSRRKGDLFNFRLKAGVDISSYSIREPLLSGSHEIGFESKTNFRIGGEAEFIMPSNKNKWSIIVEPSYQHFAGTNAYASPHGVATLRYHSFETPIGARHYFFLNEKSKIFMNGFMVADLQLNSKVNFRDGFYLDVVNSFSFAVGSGFSIGRVSAEIRYYSPRNNVNAIGWLSNYHKVSCLLGFRLF